jgi:hypothetical protein
VLQGFVKIADAAFYREEDNLGIFDVIPCHPGGGFLAFIRDALEAGHSLKAVRSVSD